MTWESSYRSAKRVHQFDPLCSNVISNTKDIFSALPTPVPALCTMCLLGAIIIMPWTLNMNLGQQNCTLLDLGVYKRLNGISATGTEEKSELDRRK